MRTIWKYVIPIGQAGRSTVYDVPLDSFGAPIRHVGLDPETGHPAVWIEVTPDAELQAREFRVFGTGHKVDPNDWQWVGTVIDAPYVWHVFEGRES